MNSNHPAYLTRAARFGVIAASGLFLHLLFAGDLLGQGPGQPPAEQIPLGNLEGSGLNDESIFGGKEVFPLASDTGRIVLPSLRAATIATNEIGKAASKGSVPQAFYTQDQDPGQVLIEEPTLRDPGWAWSTYEFAAANTFSHPLYFEDVMLERHGHERFPLLQPMVSGARFFATIPMLPYLMTVRHPCDCEYKMGHFRTGDCVHPYCQRPPYVGRAVAVEALWITGGVLIIP
jgi:hypothetical protein